MFGLLRKTVAALGLVAVASCAPEAGRFEVRFRFADETPPDGAGVFVSVRQLAPETARPTLDGGRLLAAAAPVRWGSQDVYVDVPPFPNGDRRFVVVRIQASIDEASPLLQYGLSEVFSLKADERKTIEVLVDLASAPANSSDGVQTIALVGQADAEELFVNDPNIQLILQTDTGARAEVSNFDSFPANGSDVFELDPSRALNPDCIRSSETPSRCRYQVDWNLNTGFNDDCGFAPNSEYDRQDRCPRRVFVRFSDEFGARSAPDSVDVIFDTRAPDVAPEGTSVSPEAAVSEDPILVILAFTEPIFLDTLTLEGSDYALPPVNAARAASSTVVEIQRAALVGPDGAYPILVAGRDRAGNVLPPVVSATITVDTSTPEIRAPQIEPAAVGGDTDEVTLTFEVSEPIDPGRASLQVGLLLDGIPIAIDPEGCERTALEDDYIRWTCRRRLDEARAARATQRVPVTIRVQDAAGNASSNNSLRLDIDFAPPELATVRFDPDDVAGGTPFRVTVVANEALADGDGVTLVWEAGAPIDCGVPSSTTADSRTFTCPTDGVIGDRAVELDEVTLVDRTGNRETWSLRLQPQLERQVFVDATLPVVALTPLPAETSVGRTLDIAYRVDEALPRVEVRVGGRLAPDCSTGPLPAPGPYGCSYLVPSTLAPDEADTPVNVTVTVEDAAGNLGSATQTIVVDRKAPVVRNAAFDSTIVRAGRQAVLRLRFDEPVLDPVPVFTGGNPGLTFPSGPAVEFVAQRNIAAGSPPDGTYTLVGVRARDEFGNARTTTASQRDDVGGLNLELRQLAVDTTVPAIVNLQVTPSAPPGGGPRRARAGTEVQAQFRIPSDTILAADLSVELGSTTLDCGGASQFAANALIRCSTTLVAPTPAFTRTEQLAIRAADGAGNLASNSVPILVDFEPPGIRTVEVTYRPGPGNLVVSPSEAKEESTILLLLTFNEEIDQPPATMEIEFTPAQGASRRLLFNRISWSAVTAQYEAAIPLAVDRSDPALRFPSADYQDDATKQPCTGPRCGTFVPDLRVTDLAGNVVTLTSLPNLTIRIRTQDPLLTVNQSLVSYVRSPFGNAATESLGNFTVPAGPYFALAPADGLANSAALPANTFRLNGSAAPTLVRVWADESKTTPLSAAAISPQSNGDWPRDRLALTAIDAPVAYVSGLDSAGNESAAVRIQTAWYVATTHQPTTSPITSPHDVSTSAWPTAPLAAREVVTSALAGGLDASPAIAEAYHKWQPITGPSPAARTNPFMAFDRSRGQTVLLGGQTLGASDGTWAFDGYVWSPIQLPPGPVPAATRGQQPVYIDALGETLLFEGQASPIDPPRTWLWNGASWRQLSLSLSEQPASRQFYAIAYDPIRQKAVLFGGANFSSTFRSDTWEFDGARWTEINTAPANTPTARKDHALFFDAVRGRVVLFGGETRTGITTTPPVNDMWEWTGSGWQSISPPGSVPPARRGHMVAYDTDRRRAVLYGGQSSTLQDLSDTWEWNGSTWQLQNPATSPPALSEAAAVYDSERKRVVLFGWSNFNGDGTWEWDGSSWREVGIDPTAPPLNRYGMAMAFDRARGTMIAYGGSDDFDYFADTWSGSRLGWTLVSQPPATAPSGRIQARLFYDPAASQLVLNGGRGEFIERPSDVWRWNGAAWSQVTFTGSPITARAEQGIAYNPVQGRIVVFGGDRLPGLRDDTWEFNTSWRAISTTPANTPDARYAHAMAFDENRGRVVMFGGFEGVTGTEFDDIWEWTGSAWNPINPATRPPARSSMATAYDTDRNEWLMFAGKGDPIQEYRDTWVWDGSTWREVPTPAGRTPPHRVDPAFAYDPVRKEFVMFGGINFSLSEDMWMLTPPQRATFQLGARLPNDLEESAIDGLRVRAFCGANYRTATGAVRRGANLVGWVTQGSSRGFVPLATNNTGLPLASLSAGRLERVETTAAGAKRFLLGRAMYFQCEPAGDSGQGRSEVGVDYLETRIRYVTSP